MIQMTGRLKLATDENENNERSWAGAPHIAALVHPRLHQPMQCQTPAGVVVRHAAGYYPSCDFLVVVPGDRGGATLALGSIDGVNPQTRLACRATLRTLIRRARRGDSPAQVVGQLHNLLARWNDGVEEPLLTCSLVYCVIDSIRGVIRYVNAEHPCPVAWTWDGHRLELGWTCEALGLSFLPPHHRHRRSQELSVQEREIELSWVSERHGRASCRSGYLKRMLFFTQGLVRATSDLDGRPDDRYLQDILETSATRSLARHVDAVMAAGLRSEHGPLIVGPDITIVGVDLRSLVSGARDRRTSTNPAGRAASRRHTDDGAACTR